MTAPRAGGSTGRGLRYPGNDITVDEIPIAIHNLADDIDRALGSYGAVAVQQFSYPVRLNGSNPSDPITFNLLSAIVGCVCSWGEDGFSAGMIIQFNGNVLTVKAILTAGLSINPPTIAPNPGPPVGSYVPQYLTGRTARVNAIAWGPKA
jgi:hypothetical protein